MPVTCDDCGHVTTMYTTKFHAGGAHTSCKVCEHPVHSDLSLCANPFSELVIDAIHDEQGRPLRVTSARQLREAEKRYHFSSVIANWAERDFDKPPQQQKGSVGDFMSQDKKWLYPETVKEIHKDARRDGIDPNNPTAMNSWLDTRRW